MEPTLENFLTAMWEGNSYIADRSVMMEISRLARLGKVWDAICQAKEKGWGFDMQDGTGDPIEIHFTHSVKDAVLTYADDIDDLDETILTCAKNLP
jgi:hypothetical protein